MASDAVSADARLVLRVGWIATTGITGRAPESHVGFCARVAIERCRIGLRLSGA
jgi:hypothetical protein